MDTTMARIALITASTASLPTHILTLYNIHLIPFVVQFVDENYRDDGTMTHAEFYARLHRAEVVPATAPMSVAHFIQYFEREHLDAEALIVFHGTPQTSKGYENAVQAAARVPQRRIININTRSFSMGIGLQIIAAAHAIHNGASVDDVVTLMDALAPRTLALFSPESVRYLRMSGRVGRVPALAASLLGIHPLLGLGSDGAMEVLARPRSAEAARAMILERIQQFVGTQRVRGLAVVHANAPEAAEQMQATVAEIYPAAPIYVSDAGPILAVHVGPGTLGLAVLRDD